MENAATLDKVSDRMDPSVYLFSVGHFCVDWAQAAIPALLPWFIATRGLGYQDAATLVFANMILSSVTQPMFGYYSDKIAKPWFIPLGPALCGLCISAVAFAQSYWTIFILSMLCGLGSSIFHPEAAKTVNKIAGAKKGRALSSFSIGGNAGFAVGPMMAAFCAYHAGIHALVFYAAINLTVAFLIYRKMPSLLEKTAVPAASAAKGSASGLSEPRNDWKSFAKLTFVIFARSLGFNISNAFLPMYWITVLHASPTQGSMTLTILFSLGVLMTYIGGNLADRFGFI